MPDIFGYESSHYKLIKAYQDAGLWEQRQAAVAATRPTANPKHNFDALGKGVLPAFQRAEPNAQAIGFTYDNLTAIQTMIDEVLYLKYRLPDFIHLNMNVDEGADSYLVRILDRAGRGMFIANTGTDAPVAQVSQRSASQELHYAGINALYSIEDMRRAMFAGIPLDSATLEAAVTGAMEHMEEVGLNGDTTLGVNGLINQTTGTGLVNLQTQASNMTFDDLTGMQIYNLITDDISWVIETTKETFSSNIVDNMCVYLPTQQYNRLSTRFLGDNAERAIMRAVQEDNPWTQRTGNPINFRSVSELTGAGATSGDDRMIVACKDSRVFEMGVAIMPRVIRIMDLGRHVCAPVEYKFSAVFMKRPSSIRYRDAI